jgi:diaminopimelate epimerase
MSMRTFYKMSGSGNDFVFFDTRDWAVNDTPGDTFDRNDASLFYRVSGIQALCARGTGVGADGVVFLEDADGADVRISYLNSDGSKAALCGNATLCTVRLAAELRIGGPADLRIATDSGIVTARLVDGVPEFDLGTLERLTPAPPIVRAPGESRIGFAVAGIPHLVVVVNDLENVALSTRGATLRSHSWTGTPGANVNFVAPHPTAAGDWVIRTYERGVEGETLACGTGAVATAALLTAWDLARTTPIRLWTRSGAPLDVTITRSGERWDAALRGEGRLVFRGELVDL